MICLIFTTSFFQRDFRLLIKIDEIFGFNRHTFLKSRFEQCETKLSKLVLFLSRGNRSKLRNILFLGAYLVAGCRFR